MGKTSKIRVAREYEKLSDEIKEQVKLVYSDGYWQYLIKFEGKEGQALKALQFETDEKVYLIRMTVAQAKNIVEEDDDFDDNGNLREDVQEDYERKYEDVEYLEENDNYNV